jgi:hypothetical protein
MQLKRKRKSRLRLRQNHGLKRKKKTLGRVHPWTSAIHTYYHVVLLSLMIFLIRWVTQVFQPSLVCMAPSSLIRLSDHRATMSFMTKVIFDQLNHDSLVPTFLHLQLVDQLIQLPVGTTEDIPVRIKNSFVPVDFMVFKNGLPKMSGI